MLKTKKSLLLLVLCALLNGTANRTFAQGATVETLAMKDAPVTELSEKLSSLNGVGEVVRLNNRMPNFSEKYAVTINQLIDPNDKSVGEFSQQIYVCHVGFDAPTVIVTDGYTASFALNPNYYEELSHRYKANVVAIQHRFFEQSTPVPTEWKYMRGKYAAHDMHVITNTLKTIYKGKFIASGVSKGGQNTMIYATYYPDDMDFYVPYVGPVCFGVEDERSFKHLATVGTKEQRAKILALQKEILKRRHTMVKFIDEAAKEGGFSYRATTDEILDMAVLELPYALWQMSIEMVDELPSVDSSSEELYEFLIAISDPSYFANIASTGSFYVQAAMELGYYPYNTKPLRQLLTIKNTDGYLKRLMLGEDFDYIEFDSELQKDIYKFLGENDPKMVFIYGECDPWTSYGPEQYLFKGKSNMHYFLCPGYDHKSRIRNFSTADQIKIWSILDKWMEE